MRPFEGRIYEWLLTAFARGGRDAGAVRAAHGMAAAWVSIIGNVLLFIAKFVLGITINSIALIADSIHTLSDVGTSAIALFSFRISRQGPDAEHPFGHGRVEHIASLVIAVLLLVVAIEFAGQSIARFAEPPAVALSIAAIAVLALSIVFKEVMARFSVYVGKKIDSPVLVADAWHHRSDALAALIVIIALLGSYAGIPLLDPIGGLAVSAIIAFIALSILRTSSQFLLGEQPSEALVDEITRRAQAVDGASDVHNIAVHDYGTSKAVTLHVRVDKSLPTADAHALANRIERAITGGIDAVDWVAVHIEPRSGDSRHIAGADEGRQAQITKIENHILSHADVIGLHKLHIVDEGPEGLLSVHVFVDKDAPVETMHGISHQLEARIATLFPGRIALHFEPCTGECAACTAICKKRGTSHD